MTERFSVEDVATALRAETEVAYHPQDGKGIRFLVGTTHTKLDWFQRTGHVHILTPSLTFDAYRMHLCDVSIPEGYVSFTGGKKPLYRHFWIQADGQVLLYMPGHPDRSYDYPSLRTTSRGSFNGK